MVYSLGECITSGLHRHPLSKGSEYYPYHVLIKCDQQSGFADNITNLINGSY